MSYFRDTVMLSTAVISNDAAVEFTDPGAGVLAWSNFVCLRLIIDALAPELDAQGLHLLVSTDGGSTWKSANYGHSSRGQETDGTLYGTSWTSGTVIRLMRSMGNAANEKGYGAYDIFSAPSSASFTTVTGLAHFGHFTGVGRQQHNGGQYLVTTVVNGLQISMGSGDLVSGTVTLEGIKK